MASTMSASQRPAKIPDQRVRAPALVPTPVREREPPVGSAPKKPPAMFAMPWAVKSFEASERDPSGFATAALMPAAWARATSATATAPVARAGIVLMSGRVNGGSDRGTVAMSETSCTSVPRSATGTLTTTRAMRVASAFSGLKRRARSHTATVAAETSTVSGCHWPMCVNASMNLPTVLWLGGEYPVASSMTPAMICRAIPVVKPVITAVDT